MSLSTLGTSQYFAVCPFFAFLVFPSFFSIYLVQTFSIYSVFPFRSNAPACIFVRFSNGTFENQTIDDRTHFNHSKTDIVQFLNGYRATNLLTQKKYRQITRLCCVHNKCGIFTDTDTERLQAPWVSPKTHVKLFVTGIKNLPIVLNRFCCSNSARYLTKPVLTPALVAVALQLHYPFTPYADQTREH